MVLAPRQAIDASGAKRDRVPLETDVMYECPMCFETNYIGIDPSGGRRQRFVEDCPVCCRPIDFEIVIDTDGDAVIVRAESAN